MRPRSLAALLALALGCCDGASRGSSPPHATEPAAHAPGRELAAVAREVLGDIGPAPDDGLTHEAPDLLHDPSGHALDALHAALARAARGEGSARLAFYGGSHTASDLYAGFVRSRLQRRFGDLGHGFVVAVPPIDGFWQWGARVEEAEGWSSYQPSSKRTDVDAYGLVGMAFHAEGEASAAVATERSRASRIEVMFLAQPGGGTLEIVIDDGEPQRVPTSAEEARAGHLHFGVADGEHRVALRALGDGPVRIYGVVFEREGSGVLVDQLAMVASKARHVLLWEPGVWRELLATRRLDFYALSYGNNEADDVHLSMTQHEEHFRAMLRRFREALPAASCLVIGPSERMARGPRGVWKVPSANAVFGEMQRRSAADEGCAYFDVLAWQGGQGAVERWLAADPPLERDDRIHFTDAGYHRLGATLTRALLAGMTITGTSP